MDRAECQNQCRKAKRTAHGIWEKWAGLEADGPGQGHVTGALDGAPDCAKIAEHSGEGKKNLRMVRFRCARLDLDTTPECRNTRKPLQQRDFRRSARSETAQSPDVGGLPL